MTVYGPFHCAANFFGLTAGTYIRIKSPTEYVSMIFTTPYYVNEPTV